VAGFAILSGRILPEISPRIASAKALTRLEALILHGEDDNNCPQVWAERSARRLQELGVRFETKMYPAQHEITTDMARDFTAWVVRLVREGARH
jgi:phospholipase/carboxylesterase